MGLIFLLWAVPLLPGDTIPPASDIETLRQAVAEEASAELLNFSLGDSEVSLFMTGSWKGTLNANWGLSHTDLGWSPASMDSPILFAQEADITLSLWLRERWFLEAGFLDEYDLNTYRAGYQGKEGEAVQYVGVGNTGLDYPRFPYMDLGGDSNSSFGAYGRFVIGPWTFHSLIRYDAATREERTFVGNRERSYTQVSPGHPLRGRSFVLPRGDILNPQVYLEDKNGDITDDSGRRWRKALPSEYGLSARHGLLELVSEPKGMAAVSYSNGYAELGSYGDLDAGSPGTGFLSAVQDIFDGVRLIDYPQPGQRSADADNKPGMVQLEGRDALVIYEGGTFSPFERMSRYAAPAGSSAAAILVSIPTGERIPGFEALPVSDLSVSAEIPLLPAGDTQRGVYEILRSSGSGEPRELRRLWPLTEVPGSAQGYPEIYLPGTGSSNQDMAVRFTNYGAAGDYDIGTDVVPGSVEVYRGGLSDPNIAYNAGSGTVQLKTPAGPSELIRITYLKRSEERRLGSLAAGIGAVYDSGGAFSSALGLGVRWNISSDTYSQESAASPGTVGLGGRADWGYERLKAGVSLGLGIEQPDTTGLYRVAGMEGASEMALALSASSAFITETPVHPAAGSSSFTGPLDREHRADLVYRNYQSTDILGGTSLMPVEWTGSSRVPGKNSPYPVMDSALRTEVFALEPEPGELDGSAKTWTGFQIPLGDEGEILERARYMVVPFRLHEVSSPGFTIIAQFGALNDQDAGGLENTNLMAEEVLFPTGVSGTVPQGWQNGKIYLTDGMRRKLQNARYMRILIIADPGAPFSGRVLIARPIIYGASWRAITVSGGTEIKAAPDTNGMGSVSLAEVSDASLGSAYPALIQQLHPAAARQQVLETRWNQLNAGEAPGVDGRTGAIPLENYRVLSFFIKGPNAPDPAGTAAFQNAAKEFRFVLARGPDSLKTDHEIALDAVIPTSALAPGRWSKAELHYGGGEQRVLVDGREIAGAGLKYRSGVIGQRAGNTGTVVPSAYMAAWIVPVNGTPLPEGTFSLDEIILEEPLTAYRANAGGSLEWTRPGVFLALRDKPLFQDLSVKTALETGVRGNPADPDAGGFSGAASRSSGELTILKARVAGDLALSVSTDASSWSAGHKISRAWGPFSLNESFSDAPLDKTMEHGLGLSLAGGVYSNLNGTVRYEDEKLQRQWKSALGMNPSPRRPLGIALETGAQWTENYPESEPELSNYAETWLNSWMPMVPDPGAGANQRDARALLKTTLTTQPVGAELSLEGQSNSTKANALTQSATQGRLDLPFTLGNYRFLLREERYFRRNLRYAGADIRDDGYKYAESITDSLPLWYSVPLYSLFDPQWGKTMEKRLGESDSAALFENGLFSDKFALTLYFPERYGLPSFFLPREFAADLTRTLEQKLETPLDMLILGSSLGFSALNIFGALGAAPVFRFYQSDEFRHTIAGAVNIPRAENPSWRVQDEQIMSFYGFAGAELALTNTFTAGSVGWLEGLILGWTIPAKNTFPGILYNWFCNQVRHKSSWPALSFLAEQEYEQLRKESLELVIDNTGDHPQVSVILGHEAMVRILGRLSFSAFGKLSCTQSFTTRTLSFLGSVGTTLNVSF